MRSLKILLFILIASAVRSQDLPYSLEQYLTIEAIDARQTPEGLYYTIGKNGNARKPKPGDYVKVLYKGKLLPDKTFDETGQHPMVFQIGYRQVIKGLDAGIQLIGEGGEIELYIPAHLGYGDFGVDDVVPPGADLKYEVELVQIMTQKEYDAYMVAIEEKERAAYKKQLDKQLNEDIRIIERYVRKKKIEARQLPSGIFYSVENHSTGPTIEQGDEVSLHYEGILPDGTVFDATRKRGTPFTFIIGKDRLIKGMEVGLKQFSKGDRGWIFIPSRYAYGPEPVIAENLSLPANAVLIFKVEILDVR